MKVNLLIVTARSPHTEQALCLFHAVRRERKARRNVPFHRHLLLLRSLDNHHLNH